MATRAREQLLDRLASFTPARWPGEPLSALECARRGWRLEPGPLLRCGACQAAVPARLPSAGRPRLRAECWARLRRLVAAGHRAGCRWSAAVLPAVQLRPPLPDTAAGRRRLAVQVARLSPATVPLPGDGAELELEPERATALLSEAIGDAAPHSDRALMALKYALCGWELAENEKHLRCSFGCRTWDTDRCPPPGAASDDRVLMAPSDVIQDALDQCGLEELDLEMSLPPLSLTADVAMSERGSGCGDTDAGSEGHGGVDAAPENGDGMRQAEASDTLAASSAKKENVSSDRAPAGAVAEDAAQRCESSPGDFNRGAAGDSASPPGVLTGMEASDDTSPDEDGAADRSDSGGSDARSPSAQAGCTETPMSPSESASSPAVSDEDIGSVASSPVLGGGSKHGPSPPAAAGQMSAGEGSLTAGGESDPPASQSPPPAPPRAGDATSPPPPGQPDGAETSTVSVDEGESESEAGGLTTRGGSRPVTPGSEEGSGSGRVETCVETDADVSALSADSRSDDRASAEAEALTQGAAEETEEIRAPPVGETAAVTPTSPGTGRARDQSPRASKRVADPAPALAAKRPRRAAFGPLESHRSWCPWVAGVDGGQPGWRQAVAAVSAVSTLRRSGGDGGERQWSDDDDALDTMRRVWAALDQWTSPPSKSVHRA